MVALVLLMASPALRAAGQGVSMDPQTAPYQPKQSQGLPSMTTTAPGPDDPSTAHMEQERARLAADDRQKHLLEDTAKLVQLSNDLKAEVDKSGKFVTSVTAIHEAEEIERLAHSLRDRLKN
jgi:hypothetical protein